MYLRSRIRVESLLRANTWRHLHVTGPRCLQIRKNASGIVLLLGLIADYNRNRDCDRLMVASSPIRSVNALGMPDGHLIGAQSSLAADLATHQS